jgi:sugar phosphate isomerase/epimerase
MARAAGIDIAFEFHGNTLTDTNASAVWLHKQLPDTNITQYWQPAVGTSVDYRLAGLGAILPKLSNLHLFHWVVTPEGRVQLPLEEGRQEWMGYLREAAATQRDHWALMEFVQDNAPEAFLRDAATLKAMISEL